MKTRRAKTIGDVQTEIRMALDNAGEILRYVGTLTDLSRLFDLNDDDLLHMPHVYPSTATFLREAQVAGMLAGQIKDDDETITAGLRKIGAESIDQAAIDTARRKIGLLNYVSGECAEIESVITFLSQLQTMQAEAWGRRLQKGHIETVGYWATYWLLMVKTFGGWDAAKAEVKRRFAGLEDQYRDILNESYKQAKHNG